MSRVTAYILRLDEDRLTRLNDELTLTGRFEEPVVEFQHSRQVPLVCFVLDTGGVALFVAKGRRGIRAGTSLRRLDLSSITRLERPVRLQTFVEMVNSRIRGELARRIDDGGLLTVRQFG